MKVYVMLVLLMLSSLLFGQTMWDEPLIIKEGGKLNWDQSSITTGNNEIIHVWSEIISGERGIFAKKFDNEGNSLWGEEAIIVDESANAQSNPSIISTNDGCYLIVWEDSYNQPNCLRAQKINFSGEKLWTGNGVSLAENYATDSTAQIELFQNNLGGAIIVLGNWTGSYVFSLDGDGVDQWGGHEEGFPDFFSDVQITSDGRGNLITIGESSGFDTFDFYVRRINGNGEYLWFNSFEVGLFNGYSSEVRVIYNNIDSYYVISGEIAGAVGVVKVRKISLTGVIDSTEVSIPLIDQSMSAKYLAGSVTNENGNLFLVTHSFTEPFTDGYALMAYNLDEDLNHVWDEDGVFLENSDSINQYSPVACTNAGELFISNRNSFFISTFDWQININLYRIDVQGNVHTSESAYVNGESLDILYYPYLKYDGNLFCVWREKEDGYYSLKQQVYNDNLQTMIPDDSEIITQIDRGTVNIKQEIATYPLTDSDRSLLIWSDRGYNSYDRLLYQIINADGTFEFSENGILIAENLTTIGRNYVTAQNELGQICVTWSVGYPYIIKSRIIDSDGLLLGSDEGETIYASPDSNIRKMSLSSYNNEFYLSFLDMILYNGEIYIAKTSNSTEWDEPIFLDSFNNDIDEVHSSTEMISNYCVLKTEEQSYDIYNVNESGEATTVIGQALYGDYLQYSCDSENNLFFTWENPQHQVLVQGISNTNEEIWTNPVVVSHHPQATDSVYAFNPDILISNGIYLLWNQSTDYSGNEVRAQKISSSGERMWNEDGVLLSSTANNQKQSRLEQANSDYVTVSWTEGEETNNEIYKLNLIRNDGITLLGDSNITLTESGAIQYDMKSSQLADDKAMFAWSQYYQGEFALFAQVIDFSSVDNENNDSVPVTISLLQNYPNPFNPETNISFDIPNSGQVSLDVYNLKGQKVKTLVNDKLAVGRHSVVWNGKDDSNKQVASGIYFYRMKSGTISLTQKMILMK